MRTSLHVNIFPLAICTIFSTAFSIAITAFSVPIPILCVIAAVLVGVVVFFSISRGTLISSSDQFHKSNLIIRFLLVATVLPFWFVAGLSISGIAYNPSASITFASLGTFFAFCTFRIHQKESYRYIDSELTKLEDATQQ